MSIGETRQLAHLKRETLKTHALKYDLDPALDYAKPGNSPPERAFQLLACGFDLMMVVMGAGFPARRRRGRRSARRWVRQNLPWAGANGAAFMACALPTLLAEMDGRLCEDGDDDAEAVVDPHHHLMLRRTVEDFYPKLHPDKQRQKLDSCAAEFDVIREHRPREEVTSGKERPTGYSLALMRGEEPDDDPELVEAQRRYARDYFMYKASLATMASAAHVADVRRLTRKAIPSLDPGARRVSRYRSRALAAWIEGSRPYRQYASLELQSASTAAAPAVMRPR